MSDNAPNNKIIMKREYEIDDETMKRYKQTFNLKAWLPDLFTLGMHSLVVKPLVKYIQAFLQTGSKINIKDDNSQNGTISLDDLSEEPLHVTKVKEDIEAAKTMTSEMTEKTEQVFNGGDNMNYSSPKESSPEIGAIEGPGPLAAHVAQAKKAIKAAKDAAKKTTASDITENTGEYRPRI